MSDSPRAIVAIPVRNEESRILTTLAAFTCQQQVAPQDFELLVLLNNCTDGSLALVERFAAQNAQLRIQILQRNFPPDQANIGTARRILMDHAFARLRGAGNPNGAILTTDADTVVAPRWIARNLRELGNGADLVGGRIALRTDDTQCLPQRLRQHYFVDMMHSLLVAKLESQLDPVAWNPWPRHHQNFCASLAVSARMYDIVGGVPPVKDLEDIALCDAVLRLDGRIRHSPDVKVWTSARLDGRVGVGLSSHLRNFATQELMRVQNPVLLAQKFYLNAVLRKAWQAIARGHDCSCLLRHVSDLTGFSLHRLHTISAQCSTFGSFARSANLSRAIEEAWTGNPECGIRSAIAVLLKLTGGTLAVRPPFKRTDLLRFH